MKGRRAAYLALAVAGGLIAWGCSVLAPQRDVSRFFTLTASGAAAPAPGSGGSELTYGLGPISLPPYLDRNELATRVSATELAYSDTDRWAGSLKTLFSRTLAQNLAAALGTDRIATYPWIGVTTVDYQVKIDVTRFECSASSSCELWAHWEIDDASGRPLLVRESQLSHPEAAGGSAESAAALSALVGEFGTQLAAALREQQARPERERPRP